MGNDYHYGIIFKYGLLVTQINKKKKLNNKVLIKKSKSFMENDIKIWLYNDIMKSKKYKHTI
jgi:hypothetical protein